MNTIQRFRISNQKENGIAQIFSSFKIGSIVEKEDARCKDCSYYTPKETLEIRNGFWICPKGHNNKFKNNSISKSKFFEFNLSKIIEVLENKINSSYIENKDDYLIYKAENNPVPIFFFDMPRNIGLFNEAIKRSGFFIYFNENAKNKLTNSYNENNFMSLDKFFSSDSSEIMQKLESIAKSAYPLETLRILEKINVFIKNNGSSEFEDECQKIFDSLKLKENQVIDFLDFLKHNRGNPSGNKFVKIGSNYPVDIIPIELYSYFIGILKITSNTGFDAKMFNSKLTYQVYKEKKESNTGRRLVFVISTNNIENAVWRDIIRGKENTGDWIHYVIDLDLLSLILYYIGYTDLFNLNH